MRFEAFTRQMHLAQPFVISAGPQDVADNAFVRLEGEGHWGLGEGVPSPRVTGKSLKDVLAFIAPHGTAPHIHVQVHPRTLRIP